MFGPRFQNWDLRIRHLGGNFTENPMFRSTIVNSSIQRLNNRKCDPTLFEYDFFIFYLFILLAAERLPQMYVRLVGRMSMFIKSRRYGFEQVLTNQVGQFALRVAPKRANRKFPI